MPTRTPPTVAMLLRLSVLLLLVQLCTPMQIARTWTTKHWCESVVNPEWPFAYSKYSGQVEESKGRVSTNRQDVRHECETSGVRSKCHVCEDIVCGEGRNTTCHYQLQGVDWDVMSKNIPTVSDVPWAVGGMHRYDFGGNTTTHVCMYTSGTYPCQSSFGIDYSSCKVRCWGFGAGLSGLNNSAIASSNVNAAGVNATPWTRPLPTASWSYPKASPGATPGNPLVHGNYTMLPQGFTFTLAGSLVGEEGSLDGVGDRARFSHPEGVAVDHEGYVYVADTGNHAVRMVSPQGYVTTLAGTGHPGSTDGHAVDGVEFSSPSGIAVWRDWNKGQGEIVLFIADTGNHRIRKVTGDVSTNAATGEKSLSNVHVECFAGWCGSSPQAGLADGDRNQSRFDSPRGISVSSNGTVFVADTSNHLIRSIDQSGRTIILAGSVKIAETNESGEPLEGCPAPCLAGVRGSLDGDLLTSRFSFPSDVSVAYGDESLLITDFHHVRNIDVLEGQVSTLASTSTPEEGERDGQGNEAKFNMPDAISATQDGTAYVVDASSCRIRRLTPARIVSAEATCFDLLSSLIRPSGCSSYNPPTDSTGLSATSLAGNIFYNHLYRNVSHVDLGFDFIGRAVKDCVGSPPPVAMDKRPWNDIDEVYPFNENLVVDDHEYRQREDPNDGTIVKVVCPGGCLSTLEDVTSSTVAGGTLNDNNFYSEESSICLASVHAGVIREEEGGLVDAVIHGELQADMHSLLNINATNGVVSTALFDYVTRVITIVAGSHDVIVQTIAGAPTELLGKSCGRIDSIPPQEAMFATPTGIAAYVNSSLDDSRQFLYIADRNNHAIRAVSAVCSFPCENGGRCIGSDFCQCPKGWSGADCTIPQCDTPCGSRRLCVAPNTCDCIPGYAGSECTEATCVQSCEHGGKCTAPDTCSCSQGWFDSNCTTPVCEQTCGNGGNCTAPNICDCPSDWTGPDCREPVCQQECLNGGKCIAPNSCVCPPNWSGYDCSMPVCHQGSFVPSTPENPGATAATEAGTSRPMHWLEYRPCNFTGWCNETIGFDCAQELKKWELSAPLAGPPWRSHSGRKTHPPSCMLIELRDDVLSPFQYLKAWDNDTTPHYRYTPQTPHGSQSKTPMAWNAILEPQVGFTQPWTYQMDRQVALVELHNVTQGSYVCANGGQCTAPDVCACAEGWLGFDCRTPVCNQGYFEPDQSTFVDGINTETELAIFEPFMGRNVTARLDPYVGYSNPNFTTWIERFIDESAIDRVLQDNMGRRYEVLDGSNGQGGYSCSIRAVTEWESYRSDYVHDHPNFYSSYMDSKVGGDGITYTFWKEMGWEPTHYKTDTLEFSNDELDDSSAAAAIARLFVFTDRGYMREGIWKRTEAPWRKGVCIIEFHRVCEDDPTKVENIWSVPVDALVQDTDWAFRPKIKYDDDRSYPIGRWTNEGGQCIDHVIRGCFNNGTCVAPDTCLCAEGWTGHDCATPVCSQPCFHHGNCTLPDQCTCERGWRGHDCSEPICAQECNNGGKCVAPDTCKCLQWENEFRDGRSHGGVPIYQTVKGTPQLTGWTGYDCSTPICVQAERFRYNVDLETYSSSKRNIIELGGHGKDGALSCKSARCPIYNEMVTSNDGRSFQTGCGYDPIDTGCCYEVEYTQDFPYSYHCFRCKAGYLEISAHNVTCRDMNLDSFKYALRRDVPLSFRDDDGEPQLCGRAHNPGGRGDNLEDDFTYFVSKRPNADPELSNRNWQSIATSDRFLCNRFEWEQGDFVDDAGFNGTDGDFQIDIGRHIRVNHHNYIQDPNDSYHWTEGPLIRGEGIYECYHGSSCIAPDVCTCRDGYAGFDCREPLCRHTKADGSVVVGCQNGGSCAEKDKCTCIQTISLLWQVHDGAERGITGWTGTDCSIPMCVQGYFDPFCNGEHAPGGEGCYRCANRGFCVSPDTCLCAEGWTGYDCRTPICEGEITPLIRTQLMTVDPDKLRKFEEDPCGTEKERGICALPNQCACHCEDAYNPLLCKNIGGKRHCTKPFQDPLFRFRTVLAKNEIFGTRRCSSGYEGYVDERTDSFRSCHLSIYEPNYFVKNTVLLTFLLILLILLLLCCVRRRRSMKRQRLEAVTADSASGSISFRTPAKSAASNMSNIRTGGTPAISVASPARRGPSMMHMRQEDHSKRKSL